MRSKAIIYTPTGTASHCLSDGEVEDEKNLGEKPWRDGLTCVGTMKKM